MLLLYHEDFTIYLLFFEKKKKYTGQSLILNGERYNMNRGNYRQGLQEPDYMGTELRAMHHYGMRSFESQMENSLKKRKKKGRKVRQLTPLMPQRIVVLPIFTRAEPSAVSMEPTFKVVALFSPSSLPSGRTSCSWGVKNQGIW